MKGMTWNYNLPKLVETKIGNWISFIIEIPRKKVDINLN